MDSFSFTEKELEECAVVPSFKKAKVLQLLSDIPRLCLDKVKDYLAEWRRLLSLSAHTDPMQPGELLCCPGCLSKVELDDICLWIMGWAW